MAVTGKCHCWSPPSFRMGPVAEDGEGRGWPIGARASFHFVSTSVDVFRGDSGSVVEAGVHVFRLNQVFGKLGVER